MSPWEVTADVTPGCAGLDYQQISDKAETMLIEGIIFSQFAKGKHLTSLVDCVAINTYLVIFCIDNVLYYNLNTLGSEPPSV